MFVSSFVPSHGRLSLAVAAAAAPSLSGFSSTCYLELDSSLNHMLFVNYWDSVVGTMPLTDSGLLSPGATSRGQRIDFKLSPLD